MTDRKMPKYADNFAKTNKRQSIIRPLLSNRLTRARSRSLIHVSSKYESLDYDFWENELLLQEEHVKGFSHVIWLNVIRWILYLLVGITVAVVTSFVDISTTKITYLRFNLVNNYLGGRSGENSDYNYLGYIFWYAGVIALVLVGSLVVIFIEPSAAGSGLPSVISHLNGVRIPQCTKLKVLFTKVISVIATNSAGIVGGKEGPFIHLGSIVGDKITSAVSRINRFLAKKIYFLSSNIEKRDFMAGGCAAGVAAAFGSPIGGTLLALEEGTSFWSVNLMCRLFFCASVSSVSFNTIQYYLPGHPGQHKYLTSFFFGKFEDSEINYEYFELPLFVGMGILGGLSGALFVAIAMKLILLREKYLKSKMMKLLDALAIGILTCSLAVYTTHVLDECKPNTTFATQNSLQIYCDDGDYNEFSLFWFQTQESILRMLFHGSADSFSIVSLSLFFILYCILAVILMGVSVSAGIFMPSLVLGALYGRIVGLLLQYLFPNAAWAVPGKYALLGAAAHLGGVVRITISLTVIMMEATGAISFGFPLMLTLFGAKWVGDLFTESLYESQINLHGIPVLPNDPPPLTTDIRAKNLMSTCVYVFPIRVQIKYLIEVLQKVAHHGFPVVDSQFSKKDVHDCMESYGQLRGFILRSQIMTLLANKSFKYVECTEQIKTTFKMFHLDHDCKLTIENIGLTEEEKEMHLDLSYYMNQSPYTVSHTMSFPRIFRLLRHLGLRHVIVINHQNEVIGIITRKDLAKLKIWRHAAKMGLKELRVH